MIITTDKDLLYVTEEDLDESGNFIVPDDVKNIQSFAFVGCCEKLKKIRINYPLKISEKAFYECNELKTIWYASKSDSFYVRNNLFKNIEKDNNSLSIYTSNYDFGLALLEEAKYHYKEIKIVFDN